MHFPAVSRELIGLEGEFGAPAAGHSLQQAEIGFILELRNTEKAVCGWVMWLVGASVESVAVTSCLTPYPLFMDFPEAVGTISSGIRDITPLMEAE